MVSVSDILKILDHAPIWRTLKGLPGEVSDLEERVAALEAKLEKPPAKSGEPCPACGELAMRRVSSELTQGPLREVGARDEVWKCTECGDTETRLVHGR